MISRTPSNRAVSSSAVALTASSSSIGFNSSKNRSRSVCERAAPKAFSFSCSASSVSAPVRSSIWLGAPRPQKSSIHCCSAEVKRPSAAQRTAAVSRRSRSISLKRLYCSSASVSLFGSSSSETSSSESLSSSDSSPVSAESPAQASAISSAACCAISSGL